MSEDDADEGTILISQVTSDSCVTQKIVTLVYTNSMRVSTFETYTVTLKSYMQLYR